MKVILLQKVPSLGRKHQLCSVANGYALNYLLPNKLAIPATKDTINRAEKLKEQEVMRKEEIIENAVSIKEKINGKVFVLVEKVTEKGTLYGSIGEKEIMELILNQAKIELDKNSIKMNSHIKDLGEHQVTIKLKEKIEAVVTIKVEALTEVI
jgi:large subunit ribosomal protein L9